jgi:hypothetical protein
MATIHSANVVGREGAGTVLGVGEKRRAEVNAATPMR